MAAAACGYVETAAIHELTQGIQSANQLMLNLHSANARQSLIPKILTSYHKAFSVLMHGDSTDQFLAPVPSAGSEGLVFDQPFFGQHPEHVVSRKRKGSTIQEDHYTKSLTKPVRTTNEMPTLYDITYDGKYNYNHSVNSMSSQQPLPLPSHSTETYAVASTYQPHQHQLSTPNLDQSLLNLNDNLSVHTADSTSDTVAYSFGDSIATSLSSSSTSFGLSDDGLMPACLQLISPDDELMQAYLQFNSPTTPKSKLFQEWESSESMEFLIDPIDIYFDFELINSIL